MTSTPTLANTHLSSILRIVTMRLHRRLRGQQPDSGLTVTQVAALGTIAEFDPISPSDLAAHEQVRPPSMTRVLARLEEDGLIVRSAHPSDGRQQLISVTSEGAKVLDGDRRHRDAWLTHRVAELTSEEVDALAKAMPVLERLARV